MEVFTEFDIWLFLAGLGIFLFAMHMMEESIRVLSGAAFKSMIRRYTSTKPKAILSGMFSTAILQSSSAVSLMVLAFVGAGIMNLVQAIAVMMGTKVGTTATAWIVAVFGFTFNIDAFSLPMIGIGGLGIIFLAKSPKYVNISRFLVAFGFLFMGLDFMKSSVDQVSEFIDPADFAGYGIVVFALVGLVLTAIMQSSSATIAIVLTMLFSGVVTFQAGAAMVIGANVGTTVTVLLGSIGGIHTKKQAAFSQLIFTFSTAVIALILLPVITWLVMTVLGFQDNIVLGLALFHTLFNVMGVLIFYPLIPQLASNVEKWIREEVVHLSNYIHKTDPAISDAAIVAFRKEIICQLVLSLKFVKGVISQQSRSDQLQYADLMQYNADIFEYYTKIQSSELDEEELKTLDELLRASRNFMNMVKNIHESKDEILVLRHETETTHQTAYQSIQSRLMKLSDFSREIDPADSPGSLSDLKESVKKLHEYIEEADREFIRMCSTALSEPNFRKSESTFLLMLNRIITQTCRMMVFGLKTMIKIEEQEVAKHLKIVPEENANQQ